jgi:hypothetical protein
LCYGRQEAKCMKRVEGWMKKKSMEDLEDHSCHLPVSRPFGPLLPSASCRGVRVVLLYIDISMCRGSSQVKSCRYRFSYESSKNRVVKFPLPHELRGSHDTYNPSDVLPISVIVLEKKKYM